MLWSQSVVENAKGGRRAYVVALRYAMVCPWWSRYTVVEADAIRFTGCLVKERGPATCTGLLKTALEASREVYDTMFLISALQFAYSLAISWLAASSGFQSVASLL